MGRAGQLSPTRIHQARLSAGLTQEDLAYRLRNQGIKAAARYINRWERGPGRGGNSPRADVIPVLAEALGVSIESLYENGDGSDEDEEDDQAAMFRAAYHLDRAGQHTLADDLRMRARRAVAEPVKERV